MSMLPAYDVAVIGGGVGGIYTAWRLLTTSLVSSPELSAWARARPDGKLKVAVFEGSLRTGGRLLSARPPGMPHITAEIGGMRYASSQTLVRSLVENKLQLPRHEQVVDQPQNLAYLRGSRLRSAELTDPRRLPYHLTVAEADSLRAGNAPSTLIPWAIAQLLPAISKLHGAELEAYLQTATIDGTPLYHHGFWNLIARALSFEGYQLARTTVGYDGLGWNANAVDMTVEYFGFTPDVKYYLLNGGYDLVPWSLEQEFKAAGGQVTLGAWLEGFDAAKLADGTTGVAMHFQKQLEAVTARAIVLAMPPRAIELLRQEGPVLGPEQSPHVRQMMSAVEPLPLYKLFICYPFPWWETVGVTQGRSLTDIPVRQCYYWGVEGQQYGANPINTNATIMAYNDASSVEFWGGLRALALGPDDANVSPPNDSRHLRARKHARYGAAFARKPMLHANRDAPTDDHAARLRKNWDTHKAPALMVAEMHRQLMELHGVLYAPEPTEAAFMDWSDDPYGGGVHFWNPGNKSWEVLYAMTKPVLDFPCYICGEAWSTNQTWVEGALQTSEIVLQKWFGLPPPTWVT
jgi:monoamine oxidase